MDRNGRIQVAQETMQITKQGFYYNRNGEKIMLETGNARTVYAVDPYSPQTLQRLLEDRSNQNSWKQSGKTNNCSFFLVDADSFAAAEGMEAPLVMNFANARHAGGGFLKGSSAQEESLCRCSTLYTSIHSNKAMLMYDYNNANNSDVDSDYMLLSPNVIVFRDAADLTLLDQPFHVGVVTVAAPDKKRRAKDVPKETLDLVMKDRLRKMLCLAAKNQYKTLVLGAWGCGAFGNEPEDVAGYFYDLLIHEHFADSFSCVIFAVLGGGKNYDAFKKVFGSMIEDCSNSGNTQSTSTGSFFIEANIPFPICNHTVGIRSENLGYTQGILMDGTPFEAELWENEEGIRALSVLISEKEEFIESVTADILQKKGRSEKAGKIVGMHWEKGNLTDYSALPIGMAIRDPDISLDELKYYTDYLEQYGLIQFTGSIRDGYGESLTDIEGHDLIHMIITLSDNENQIAETSLRFKGFWNMPEKTDRSEAKLHLIKK